MQSPVDLLSSLPLGTRVVVRRRLEQGFTDSLGDLVARDGTRCTVRTRSGDDVVLLADVTAARRVPPTPPRRAPRRSRPETSGHPSPQVGDDPP